MRETLRRRSGNPRRGTAYAALRWTGAGIFAAVLAGLVITLIIESAPALGHSGLGFFFSGTWNPADQEYGAGILVVGTVVTTGLAMVMSVPVGLGVAIFISELAPRWLAAPLSAAIDFLAAVPSIVVGLWALLVLSPIFAAGVEPFLEHLPVLGALFTGPAYGPSILLAAVVLAVMTLPTVVALSRTALRGVAASDREAAMALGATRWQVIRRAVFPGARAGIAAAVTLAMGRALGESIAVVMVIGNNPSIPHSLLSPGATLGSAIINQFAEATPGLATSSIIGLAAVLLVLTVLVNIGGQVLLRRRSHPPPARGAPLGTGAPAADHSVDGDAERESSHAAAIRRRQLLRARARASLGRRHLTGGAMEILCATAALAAAAPLGALVVYTVSRGAAMVSTSFITDAPTPAGVPGGGISTAIVGSAEIMGLALAMSVPLGLLAALFLYERPRRAGSAIRFGADVLTGVPSIVIGIFAYALIVVPTHVFSNLAASFALAVLMVPIMIRANEEAMRAVPTDLWEAGMALGASRSRVARNVVIRGALPGIVTGNLLAAARGVGETAPLLFTVAAPTMAMTLYIFSQGTQPFASAQQTAWGTALVLLTLVLVLSVAARTAAWGFSRRAH
ncbi:MAG: phosphate ABC transporter permease subunit PstC [Candidatus Dormiibacterota bacterium]